MKVICSALPQAIGKVLWSKNLQRDFGGIRQRWGYAGSPLVDGNLVIVDSGGVGASTVALDKATGALKWKAGNDEAGYSSPVAFDLGGTRCVAIFKADALVGLNAANGQELWRYPWQTRIRYQCANANRFRRQDFHHLGVWHWLRSAAGESG